MIHEDTNASYEDLFAFANDAIGPILKVEHYFFAIGQLAQTTMRNAVGEVPLDSLLSKREEVATRIKTVVDKDSDQWGIDIESVNLKHIELPNAMKRIIAKEAEAERERRAIIIKSQGEKIAANNLAEAADMLDKAPGAIHLRTLQSLNDVSSDRTNRMHFVLPLDTVGALKGIKKK